MTDMTSVLQLLGLPLTAGVPEVLEAIKAQQRQTVIQRRRGDAMEEAWKTEHARAKRAEDPNNWRAVWTGDTATDNIETTALNHGNLVELSGVGQVLMHFRPCCQDLRCECRRRLIPGGFCACHENDE